MKRQIIGISMLATCGFLSGCMALALAPLAPLVGGLSGQTNEVAFDIASLSPEMKQSIKSAKKIVVLSNEGSVPYFAEALEKGGYEVFAEDPPKTATPSQRRNLMRDVCAKSRPDIVLSPSAARSDAGGASTTAAMFIGRAIVNLSADMDVLKCSDRSTGKFVATIKINQGAYNMDQTKMNQVVGDEFGKAFLTIFRK